MTKKELIKKIKTIITNYGSFTTADINAESSPCTGSLGRNAVQLAESFYQDKIEAVTYVHDNEESSDYILYEDLKKDVLEEILELAETYKEQTIEEGEVE